MRGFAEAYKQGVAVMDEEPAEETSAGLPARRPSDHSRLCTNCLSLAHYWSSPVVEDIELPVIGERYGLYLFSCVCKCGCPARMTTVGPPMGPEVPKWEERRGEDGSVNE